MVIEILQRINYLLGQLAIPKIKWETFYIK